MFRVYIDKYSALSAALKRGKEVADVEVENALFKRAIVYRYDEVTREAGKVMDPYTGEWVDVMAETKRVTKEVQPDVTAQIFWLKNRRPEKWCDKQEIGQQKKHGKRQRETAILTGHVPGDTLTREELAVVLSRFKKKYSLK